MHHRLRFKDYVAYYLIFSFILYMKKPIYFIVLLPFIGVVLFYQSCTYDVQTPNTCFQEDVLPIFITKCNYSGCHNAQDHKEGYDLSTYDGIMKGVTAGKPFQSEVFTQIRTGEMPPSHYEQLSQLERSTIKSWIKSGAENTSNCYSCDTNSTYTERIRPMMQKWCVTCHTSGNAGGGYDLSTYTGLALAVSNNRLLGCMNQESGYSAMPKNSGPISTCDIQAIEKWISKGYPEN